MLCNYNTYKYSHFIFHIYHLLLWLTLRLHMEEHLTFFALYTFTLTVKNAEIHKLYQTKSF